MGKEFKLAQYADDTVFFLTDPENSLTALFKKTKPLKKLQGIQ